MQGDTHNTKTNTASPANAGREHYIVAIGASAGGLEAIHEFFDHLPESHNLSFVIIQHLSPDYKSLLVELVARHTHMKVFEAENELSIQKNCIYVIPNNKLMTIRKNKLQLAEKKHEKAPNTAIDSFLYTLAKEKKNHAIAIILSGTGTDGTKGIAAIKNHGGVVLVQDPATAKFDGMPNSAIASGNADLVLAPADMPAEMFEYIHEKPVYLLEEGKVDDTLLEEIFRLIHAERGYDFHYYKTPTIIRRISRRMLQKSFSQLEEYVAYLRQDPQECRQLGKDFLISVTQFFRDAGAYQLLREKVIPLVVNAKMEGEVIKIWIAACSTGEEAYSIAIAFDEYLQTNPKNLEIKVFATDMDETNIAIASRGAYPFSIERDMDVTLLQQYFIRDQVGYTVIPRIRKQIVFARHNIIKDPPFIKNDFVSCRNMLIYMSTVLQQKVFSILLFSLQQNGYLFLGSSENPGFIREALLEISSKWKVYRKISNANGSSGIFYNNLEQPSPLDHNYSRAAVPAPSSFKSKKGLAEEFQRAVADEFYMAAFYIDQQNDIKESTGNFEHFLSLPRKILQLNLLKMLPQEVSGILGIAIRNAWKTGAKKVVRHMHYRKNDQQYSIHAIIRPPGPLSAQPYMMVVLGEAFLEPIAGEAAAAAPAPATGQPLAGSPQGEEYISELETELQETRYNLQMAVEGLETANEELQSSNEELLSANEELQSSNEELQSLNEELHTLNTEHQLKIKELIELNDDLNNYFRSSDIAQVFLDTELRIRKFNPASVKMINFIETDTGRPISHISTNIRYAQLVNDIQGVLQTGQVVEKEIQLLNGKNLLVRIMPYIRQDKQKGGIIIAFVDISTITDLNNIIRAIFNSSRSSIIAFKSVRDQQDKIVDFVFQTANHAAGHLLPQPIAHYAGCSLRKDAPELVQQGLFERYVKVVQHDKMLQEDIHFELPDERWYEITAVKMMDGFVATYTDISEKKLAEQRLRKSYNELIAARENLKKLNAQLEYKVSERTRELSVSEERFRLVSQATNDAIWDWDFVNNQLWWSDSFFHLFGYAKGSYDRSFWIDQIHPAEQEAIRNSIYGAINSNDNQWAAEYRFRRADGQYAHILDRAYVLHDEFGTPYRMLGSMLDVTQLKKTEQALANNIAEREFIAESMPLVIWTAGADRKVDFVNRQFESYTGIGSTQALKGQWAACLPNEDLQLLNTTWEKASETKADFKLELKMKTAAGEYHWNLLRAKARKNQEGSLINWVITATDIDEQKVINEVLEQKVALRTAELKKMNAELENSNNDLQQFASVASHDLQEPLRKIHMFSKLIKDKYAPEISTGALDYLNRILYASVRMRTLIADILNFSRLSANIQQFEPTDLGQLVSAILDDLEIAIMEKKATVRLLNLPVIDAIPGQMRQVFQNLISNSLKFIHPAATPAIIIGAERVREKSFNSIPDTNGLFCKITVKDNGIGFDARFKSSIFTLFQRLHSKDRYEGSGIGLAITKKIIDKHNGLITADSTEGQGATFILVLPVRQEEQPADAVELTI